ncbi:type I restriction-modification system endonuclease [Luteimonas qiangzhengi]|uniref:type I restriction-modification system endonuclease n=1 Tax=Luteimonas sp. MJ146 TaxID=3129240 RepID=UPI0031BB3D57
MRCRGIALGSTPVESNFWFLRGHDPVFLILASMAEQVFAADPNTTLIKLRQLGEAFAKDLAGRAGLQVDERSSQADLIFQLSRELRLDPRIRELFHVLRVEGNKATHGFATRHREAMDGLKIARELAVWYHRAFGRDSADFKPGPFSPPSDPAAPLREVQAEVKQLQAQLDAARKAHDESLQLANLQQEQSELHAALAEAMDVEAREQAALVAERERELAQLREEFDQRIAGMSQAPDPQVVDTEKVQAATHRASQGFDLSEDLTRILIDQQLQDADWEADSLELTYANGTRPEKGVNRAIAEWPTRVAGANADYVLFCGLVPVAIVEAKRKRINVADRILQAERYARDLVPSGDLQPAWREAGLTAPWPDGQDGTFHVPLAFSCNGRPYIRQLAEQSGIWFRDLRRPSNLRRALQGFHTPDGIADLLRRDVDGAQSRLAEEGMAYLRLRDYQQHAIQAVEDAMAAGQRTSLLAMATGTGKTRTIIGLIYRLLKTERFRRILFLVDRSALGEQAQDAMGEMRLEQNQTLSQIYNLDGLQDTSTADEARVQVATVQAMVRRIFQSDSPPPIDTFDCIVVDEAHRGYTLDQEMTEGELAVRNHAQYMSQYRRVLDYFDAHRVGLTATPAKHTTDIFGKPVYTYSYREAVADDWLIDHEPPIRYETLLNTKGIHFERGEQVNVVNVQTGEVDTTELEDDLDFNVESFNRRVITPAFDQVICEQLARELDPDGDEKTLIFCISQAHAERVKHLLDEAFKAVHGDQYNQASVAIITGRSDKVDALIRRYKNERHPNIAITVDLLTTGIDVPAICNLVFMRRVRSRILYEQMKGRATRRCDDIGKTVFRIYDPVDLYAALEEVDTMKPLVKDPNVSIEQLLHELKDPRSLAAPGGNGDSHAQDVLDQLGQKLMRVLRKAAHRAAAKPTLRDKLDQLEAAWGVAPERLHTHLHALGPQAAAKFLHAQPLLLQQLAEVGALLGSDHYPIISTHQDELIDRQQNYGVHEQPADYLESFNRFVRENLNQSVALSVVVTRPRDLTRAQLREIRLLLDEHGFSEANLRGALRESTQQEIAASIIGHIRRAALGEALVPFEHRVGRAMQTIYASRAWTPLQRRWLERLAQQLVHEVVLDREVVQRNFEADGGAPRLDKLLDGQLDQILNDIGEQLWHQAG